MLFITCFIVIVFVALVVFTRSNSNVVFILNYLVSADSLFVLSF